MSRIDVAIVFPVYESARLIREAVRRVCDVCDRHGVSYEIVLCDDGSSDGSRDVLAEICARDARVRMLVNERNHGLGYTLRRLLAAAAAEYVVYCDLDLPFGAGGVMRVIEQRMSADVTVASRYSGIPNHVVWWRRLLSRCYWIVCRILFRIPVRDIGSGTVGFFRSRVQTLNLAANGFDIHPELYVKAARMGLTIQELPLSSQSAPSGTFSVFRHAARVFFSTLQLKIRLAREHTGTSF